MNNNETKNYLPNIFFVMLNDGAAKTKSTNFSNVACGETSWNKIVDFYRKNPYNFGQKKIGASEFTEGMRNLLNNQDYNGLDIVAAIRLFLVEKSDIAKIFNGNKDIVLRKPSRSQIRKEVVEFGKEHNVKELKKNVDVDSDYLEIDGIKIDSEKTWVVRTKDGTGPTVVMDNINIDEDRHNVRRYYQYTYKIDYFNIRECRAKYWIEHPEHRYHTMD